MSASSFDIQVLNKKQSNIVVTKSSLNALDVKLHGHLVFSFWNNEIKLNSCGYKTPTTKTAINRALSQLHLSYTVVQKKSEWFLSTPDSQLIPFTDGMSINL